MQMYVNLCIILVCECMLNYNMYQVNVWVCMLMYVKLLIKFMYWFVYVSVCEIIYQVNVCICMVICASSWCMNLYANNDV